MSRRLSIRDIERMENTSGIALPNGGGVGTSGDIYCDLTSVIDTITKATATVIQGTDVSCPTVDLCG